MSITIDGRDYPLPDDTDVEELRRRVAQAIFRCEVEQLHLADGRTMLVNWRSVRTVFIGGLPVTAPPADRWPIIDRPGPHPPTSQSP